MTKNLRYLILLLILLFVLLNEVLTKFRVVSWERPLQVQVFAINGDARGATANYIQSLDLDSFRKIQSFINGEAKRYGIQEPAIEIVYRGLLSDSPPIAPSGRNILENIYWSLKFRAWSFKRAWQDDGESADIELYVRYFDTATTESLRHSVGLEGGQIAIINAFADPEYRGSNQVVIAHEFMHTLGASDKYAQGNQPIYPEGYAEPYRQPLHPQRYATLMGGRIPLSDHKSAMPQSLDQVLVGIHTAGEIYWLTD